MARRTCKPRDSAKDRAWRRTLGGRDHVARPLPVVLTSLSILRLVNDYNAYMPVNFSLCAHAEKRDEPKRLIESQRP